MGFGTRCAALLTFCLAACANNDFDAVAPLAGDGRSLSEYRLDRVEVSFADGADLEWCEDNLMQCDMVETRVAQTFEAGARDGMSELTGPRGAFLRVTVETFDSITLFERYTMGGVHYVDARFQLVDAATGAALTPETPLDFDLIALGRAAGHIANLRGRTQRVRIAERIADVTRQWLSALGAPVT